jgi:Pyruvate-formate lyase-activating enzyme
LTEDAVRRLAEAGMEAMNIDIKGGRRTYRRWLAAGLDGVLSTARAAKSLGVHIEFTYLVIPGVNDDEAEEVVEAVTSFGRETPLHVTAYYPAHRLTNPPTPPELLEDIWRRAKRAGLRLRRQHTGAPRPTHLLPPLRPPSHQEDGRQSREDRATQQQMP